MDDIRDPLHIGELVHDGEIYDQVNRFDDDLPFYRHWSEAAAGPILELCCGTGRLTVPLRKAGFDIAGLDATESMLARARNKALDAGLELELYRGDMRTFSLEKKYAAVFIPFNSLHCLYTATDLEQVLARVREHLLDDGWLVFDVFNPDILRMIERRNVFTPVTEFTLPDGRHVELAEIWAYDEATQVNRCKWRYVIDGVETLQNLDVRCFFPCELDALLRYNSFQVVYKYGDFDGAPFVSASPKQIYVCQPCRPDG